MNLATRRMVESAILIAIGTVLSIFSFQGPWALGGSVTICSMLPLAIIAWRYGTRWGLLSAFIYAVIQMVLGFSNVGYGRNAFEMLMIVLLDYIIAFTVIGFSAMFKGRIKNDKLAVVMGILVTFVLRFVCHFLSGWLIWEALWPNGYNYAAPVWSLLYNGSYMLPEIIITAVVAWLSFIPLKKYWLGEGEPQA